MYGMQYIKRYTECISLHVRGKFEFLLPWTTLDAGFFHRMTNGLASSDLQSVSCSL